MNGQAVGAINQVASELRMVNWLLIVNMFVTVIVGFMVASALWELTKAIRENK